MNGAEGPHFSSARSRLARLIKPRSTRYERRLQQILTGQRVPRTLCLNDGGGSHLTPNWDRHVVEFLQAHFPAKSPFER